MGILRVIMFFEGILLLGFIILLLAGFIKRKKEDKEGHKNNQP
jgi:hypothetical protein